MNKLITLSTSTAVLSGLLLITGCSSDDGGGGVAVPVNAAPITALNAYTLVQRATTTGYAISAATEANNTPDQFAACDPTGSSTNTIVENDALLSFSAAGTVTLNDCGTYVSGVPDFYFINGTLTYSETENVNAATFAVNGTENISGSNIGMATSADTVTVNGLVTAQTYEISNYGFGSGSYSLTSQFSYDSLTLEEGFFAQTTTPLKGPTSWPTCPTSGVVLVTGAAGSQAKGTFANDGNVLIEYHTGDYVWIPDNTYPCSSFES